MGQCASVMFVLIAAGRKLVVTWARHGKAKRIRANYEEMMTLLSNGVVDSSERVDTSVPFQKESNSRCI